MAIDSRLKFFVGAISSHNNVFTKRAYVIVDAPHFMLLCACRRGPPGIHTGHSALLQIAP